VFTIILLSSAALTVKVNGLCSFFLIGLGRYFPFCNAGKVSSSKRSISRKRPSTEVSGTWIYKRCVRCWWCQTPWMAWAYVSYQPTFGIMYWWVIIFCIIGWHWHSLRSESSLPISSRSDGNGVPSCYRCLVEYIPTLQLTIQQQVCAGILYMFCFCVIFFDYEQQILVAS